MTTDRIDEPDREWSRWVTIAAIALLGAIVLLASVVPE